MESKKVTISKDLKTNPIYQESLKFRKKCKQRAENIIKNKENYLKQRKFTNAKTLVSYLAEYDINKDIKKEKEVMNQKARTICESAFKKNLIPVFITIPLSSMYHPFRTIKINGNQNLKIFNKKFKYKTLEDGLIAGANFLKDDIWQNIYDNSKEKFKKDMLFIKVFEMHKSGVLHLHIIVFVPDPALLIEQTEKVLKKNCINLYDIQEIGKDDNYKRIKESRQAANYILKTIGYVSKSINEDNIENYKIMKGAKGIFGLQRWFSHSVKEVIPTYIWNHVYRAVSSDKDLKLHYEDKAKEEESCLMSTIKDDSYIVRMIYDKDDRFEPQTLEECTNLRLTGIGDSEKAKLNIVVLLERNINEKVVWIGNKRVLEETKSYNVKELVVYLGKKEIYRKEKYIMEKRTLEELKQVS